MATEMSTPNRKRLIRCSRRVAWSGRICRWSIRARKWVGSGTSTCVSSCVTRTRASLMQTTLFEQLWKLVSLSRGPRLLHRRPISSRHARHPEAPIGRAHVRLFVRCDHWSSHKLLLTLYLLSRKRLSLFRFHQSSTVCIGVGLPVYLGAFKQK